MPLRNSSRSRASGGETPDCGGIRRRCADRVRAHEGLTVLRAGAVAISGRLLPEVLPYLGAADALRGMPVLIVHGTADEKLGIRLALWAREQLERTPVTLTYRELPIGHTITEASLAEVTSWLARVLSTHTHRPRAERHLARCAPCPARGGELAWAREREAGMPEGYTIVAGASGKLGRLIVEALAARDARVRALLRRGGPPEARDRLRALGAVVEEVEFDEPASLVRACAGGSCVVSALSGLREVIVGAQSRLLDAAVAAGIPRFIPSDYCIDYATLPRGRNRNLDLRADFRARLDAAPIAATSVLNGMFTDLLVGPAPVVLFPLRRVVYWGHSDQPLDFTTIADTAAVTAAAALEPRTPRFLRVAGDVVTARELADAASDATGHRFRLLRAGGLRRLEWLIWLTRRVAPGRGQTFPAWQGMQYLRDMFSGRVKLAPLDNARFPSVRWTSVREVLARRESGDPQV